MKKRFCSLGAVHAERIRRVLDQHVTGVESVGMTVSDLDRSVEFYTKVLSFRKVSESEVAGEEFEHLQGVFGLRMRIARLQLGETP